MASPAIFYKSKNLKRPVGTGIFTKQKEINFAH